MLEHVFHIKGDKSCHHIIHKISFLLSDLWLHLQNLIFMWCNVVLFIKSHKYKAQTSFLHGALGSHLQNLLSTMQKPDTHKNK